MVDGLSSMSVQHKSAPAARPGRAIRRAKRMKVDLAATMAGDDGSMFTELALVEEEEPTEAEMRALMESLKGHGGVNSRTVTPGRLRGVQQVGFNLEGTQSSTPSSFRPQRNVPVLDPESFRRAQLRGGLAARSPGRLRREG